MATAQYIVLGPDDDIVFGDAAGDMRQLHAGVVERNRVIARFVFLQSHIEACVAD